MNRARLILVAACALLALAAVTLVLRASSQGPGQGSGTALVGGPFQLIDQDGRAVDQSLLDGKWTAVYFGFTYCPDLCPTTLQTLAQAQALLGPKAKDFRVAFISVDPGRDTPAQLKTYLSSPVFPRGAVGLTGSPQQIAAVAKAYRAPYEKQGDDKDYVVNHTSIIYLMDPHGRFNRVLAYGLAPGEIARQISAAMQEGPHGV
jgi:protein SCO1/2